jgi:chromosome partitioning protein
MQKCIITAVASQKGGVAKSTTALNLGYALAKEGKRVLLADLDSQCNLTMGFGIKDELPLTMPDLLGMVIQGEELPEPAAYVQKSNTPEITLDIIPSNINLAATEINLRDEMGGEQTLRELLTPLRGAYDNILLDCSPSIGNLTINALAACNNVIIPVSPQSWSATGLTDLLQTIVKVKRKINPEISVAGILLTICDERTRLYREVKTLLEESYGEKFKIFTTHIPSTVKVGEANLVSLPIAEHDPGNKAAQAYANLAKEVLHHE